MGAAHGARCGGCGGMCALMESMVLLLLLLFLFPLMLLLLISRVSRLLSGGSVELLWFVVWLSGCLAAWLSGWLVGWSDSRDASWPFGRKVRPANPLRRRVCSGSGASTSTSGQRNSLESIKRKKRKNLASLTSPGRISCP